MNFKLAAVSFIFREARGSGFFSPAVLAISVSLIWIMLTKITRTVVRSFSTTNAAAAAKPTVKPSSPDFSSGPCKKRPGWTVDALSDGALGRSHRSALGKAKLKKCIEDQKRILGIPDDYHLGIVPVSYLHCCFCMSLCSLMFILQQPPPSRSVTNTGQ